MYHHGDSPLLAVITGDRNGNALALLIQAKDNELAGLGMLCNKRRFDFKQTDALRIIQISLGYYLIHGCTPFAVLIERNGLKPLGHPSELYTENLSMSIFTL